MNTFRAPFAAKPSVFFCRIIAALSLCSWPVLAAVDLNNDGVGDLWALKFNAVGAAASDDLDGDGKTNASEAIAGTDPHDSTSRLEITSITMDVDGVHLTWLSVAGKRYRVQSTDTFEPANWQDLGSAVMGTGAYLTAEFAPDDLLERQYYRVMVEDADTDNDGVSNWEELIVGYDANSSYSAGAAAGDDLTRLKAALQGTNQIRVDAADELAAELGREPGTFVITRSGGLIPVTVNLSTGGTATSGVDYTALPTTVSFGLAQNTAVITVTPEEDSVAESTETVTLTVATGTGYTVGTPRLDTVLIQEKNTGTGNGIRGRYYQETSALATNPPTFTNERLTRIDDKIDFTTTWPGSPVVPTNFSARWIGEILPQYSQIYTFYLNMNRGGRVWVNGELVINNFPRAGYTVVETELSGTIQLEAGVRCPILVEFYETTGDNGRAQLSWSSANQPKQIVPKDRLFADMPPQITSAKEVTLLKNSGNFTYQIQASGTPTSYTATNFPTNWTFNATTGVLAGAPLQVGTWRIPLSATNAHGTGASVLTLTVSATGGSLTREVWDGAFATMAALEAEFATTPDRSGTIPYFEGPRDEGGTATDQGLYGSRLRGYITPPLTGIYRFWLTGDNQAELWLSNDDDPVNSLRRAVLPSACAYRAWDSGAVTPSLWLTAGQRYYVEVRHIESGGPDHVSVGWLKPGDTDLATQRTMVPGYALSPWVETGNAAPEGVLYTANLTPQGSADSHGYGLATLRLNPAGTQAIVSFNYANLTGPVVQKHVHDDRLPSGANIVFDLDEPDVQRLPDGSYVWPIVGAGTLSATEVAEGIRNGSAYFNIHTPLYMAGEVKGYYRRQDGSSTFTPPADPPAWTDDHTDRSAAARFLNQATFGTSEAEISRVNTMGYEAWIDDQFTKTATLHYPDVFLNRNQTNPNGPVFYTSLNMNSWWKNSIRAEDQLRQRMAFAWSEIMVVSSLGVLEDRSDSLSSYYDTLLNHSFGNFRDLLEAVTLTPAMGRFLDMLRNDKPDKTTGRIPNENYAREILQLFSIGLNRMHPDGSLLLSSKGLPIPTYDQETIVGFSHAFTGWTYNQANVGGLLPTNWNPAADWINPMKQVPGQHFTGPKRLFNNEVSPGLPSISGVPLDPYAVHTTTQIQNSLYQALPAQELDITHDAIFNHPNTGPFICRQLIQRLVTSTPSRGYIYRVAQKFNNNGSGVRGDLKAVLKAILLDYEARSPAMLTQQGFGKQREPVIRTTALARAFPETAAVSGNFTQTGPLITITSSTPHRLNDGNVVSLDFTGAPSAHDASYGGSGASNNANYLDETGTNTFIVRAKDVIEGTYSQSGTTVTATTAIPHGLVIGDAAQVIFTSGNPSAPASDRYVLTAASGSSLTFTVATSVTRTGNLQITFFKGSYSQPANGTGVTNITVTTTYPHGLANNTTVHLNFTGAIGQTTTPTDGIFSNVTVVDAFRFTVTHTVTPTARTGTLVGAGTAAVVNRSGTVNTTYSNWQVGNTETDLGQTPMRALSVFNFFEPDYQFPGPLSEAGLITPEFQLTSDTNVIRQANFIYSGLVNPANNFGVSSLRGGAGNICLDIGRWMQNRSTNSLPWTNNENLDALIDELNILLCAGQMPWGTGPEPSSLMLIRNYVQNTANVGYNNSAPTEINKRDRLRAIIHLMTAAPDFAIQK